MWGLVLDSFLFVPCLVFMIPELIICLEKKLLLIILDMTAELLQSCFEMLCFLCFLFSFCWSLYTKMLNTYICRMASARIGQWLSPLVCLLILLKAESHPVELTLVQSAVAKGAGEKNQVFFHNFISPIWVSFEFEFYTVLIPIFDIRYSLFRFSFESEFYTVLIPIFDIPYSLFRWESTGIPLWQGIWCRD